MDIRNAAISLWGHLEGRRGIASVSYADAPGVPKLFVYLQEMPAPSKVDITEWEGFPVEVVLGLDPKPIKYHLVGHARYFIRNYKLIFWTGRSCKTSSL